MDKTMLIQKMHEWHTDENNDYTKYEDMAKALESDGYYHEAGMLRDIAHDEKTHANAIAYIIGNLGEAHL